jgi:hypothetical protein
VSSHNSYHTARCPGKKLIDVGGMESGSEYRIPYPFRVEQVDPSISRPVTTSHIDDTPSESAYGMDLENQDSLGLSRRRIATAEF